MKMQRRILLVAVLLAAVGCCPVKETPGRMHPDPWSLQIEGGGTLACELGTLVVPENRDDPHGRMIKVGFLRFPALRRTGAPPTIHLPDGPGKSFLINFNAYEMCPTCRVIDQSMADYIEAYRQCGDVIFIDQRGYSKPGDILTYPCPREAQPYNQPGSARQRILAQVEAEKRAVEDFKRNTRVDLRGYSIQAYAEDVRDLAQALGYPRVTLVGHSFGGQWAFATMKLFPDLVARAVIIGVEPLDCAYDMPSHVYAALQRTWWNVEQDPRFQCFLPRDGSGMAGAVRKIIHRLKDHTVKYEDKDNPAGTVVLGRDDFQPDTLKPAMILAIYHEQYETWAHHVCRYRRAGSETEPAIQPLIDSSLRVSALRRQMLRTDAVMEVLGQWFVDSYTERENVWPTRDLGDCFRDPVQTRIPTLFIQGTCDLKTPMENLLHVLPYFVNGRTILVENGKHELFWDLPAVRAAVLDFIRTGDAGKAPSSVKMTPSPFEPPDIPFPYGCSYEGGVLKHGDDCPGNPARASTSVSRR
jgi:pimeloyl-ACP methyl ester carboxylesterase